MEGKSKLKTVQGNGNWKEFYKFDVEFEDGNGGTIYRKTNEPKVTIGEEYNYSINDKGSVKIVNPNYQNNGFNGGGSNSPKTDEQIVRMNSVTNAVAYCRGSNCSPEEILETSQIFRDWIMADCCEAKKPQVPELQINNDPF